MTTTELLALAKRLVDEHGHDKEIYYGCIPSLVALKGSPIDVYYTSDGDLVWEIEVIVVK